MDWSAWKKALELYDSTPELIAASIVIVIAVFGFAWWLRSHIGKERIASLQDANKHLVGELGRTREDLRLAKEDQGRVTKELVSIKDEKATMVSAFQSLSQSSKPLPSQQVFIFTNSSATIDRSLSNAQDANTAVDKQLSIITARLEATEEPDEWTNANGQRDRAQGAEAACKRHWHPGTAKMLGLGTGTVARIKDAAIPVREAGQAAAPVT
jgi:hypothetical protein